MNYRKIYDQLIFTRCQLRHRDHTYTELHHIIPKCLGGNDACENLVELTAREHFLAHRLLAKIYPEAKTLSYAVWMMLHTRNIKVSSRVYENTKILTSEASRRFINELWKREGFLEKMAEMKRANNTKLWDDERFREKMKFSVESFWSDEKNRAEASLRMSNFWKGRSTVEIESRMRALRASQGLATEGLKQFYKSNPWPWQRNGSGKTKSVWRMAATFWILREEAKLERKTLGYSKFSDEYLGGKFKKITQKMQTMFRDGWNPLECVDYVREFRGLY